MSEVIDRSIRAKELMDNKFLWDLLDGLESDLIDKWRYTVSEADRTDIWHAVKSIDCVREKLHNLLSAGKIEQARENERNEQK